MKVKTVWNYSKETETDRLVQCAANTFNRFYLKNNFLVLPYLYQNGNTSSTVYLPDVDLQEHISFIKSVKKINPTTIPVSTDKKLYKTASDILQKSNISFDEAKVEKLESAWSKKENGFWNFLESMFPQLKGQALKLEIRPTNLGTNTSFAIAKKEKSIRIITIYIRIDQSTAQIAESILSSLFCGWLMKDKRVWCDNWQENEAVIDFLMTKTHLKDTFPDYRPTLKDLRQKQLGNLVSESQKYLKKLGVAGGEIFSLKEDRVLIDQKYPFINLTVQEYRLLRLLVENKNQPCPMDAIGDILWQDESDGAFSLWAIAKQIERLRQKLQMHGLSPSLIQSQRGQGYLLKD